MLAFSSKETASLPGQPWWALCSLGISGHRGLPSEGFVFPDMKTDMLAVKFNFQVFLFSVRAIDGQEL